LSRTSASAFSIQVGGQPPAGRAGQGPSKFKASEIPGKPKAAGEGKSSLLKRYLDQGQLNSACLWNEVGLTDGKKIHPKYERHQRKAPKNIG